MSNVQNKPVFIRLALWVKTESSSIEKMVEVLTNITVSLLLIFLKKLFIRILISKNSHIITNKHRLTKV